MTITGVIAEFNPFHNGHKYLLDQMEGLKIVAMSGNFVQRGEPAIVDKWTRAQMALEGGADLVVELVTVTVTSLLALKPTSLLAVKRNFNTPVLLGVLKLGFKLRLLLKLTVVPAICVHS